jgi:hypothetical protein
MLRHFMVVPIALTALALPAIAETTTPDAVVPAQEAPKPVLPPSTDTFMVQPLFYAVNNDGNLYGVGYYWNRATWITPNFGVTAMIHSATGGYVHAMTAFGLPWGLNLRVQAGSRFAGFATSYAKAAPGFSLGPEVALTLSKSFLPGFSGSIGVNYCHQFPLNSLITPPATTPSAWEMYLFPLYNAALHWQVSEKTKLSLGVLGWTYSGTQTGLKFSDIGPTMAITQSF